MFEPCAHLCIANPDEIDGIWALKLMSGDKGSNSFVLCDSELPETVLGFLRIRRQLLSFQPEALLLYDDAYYMPTIINHPLFDSFVIGFSTPT